MALSRGWQQSRASGAAPAGDAGQGYGSSRCSFAPRCYPERISLLQLFPEPAAVTRWNAMCHTCQSCDEFSGSQPGCSSWCDTHLPPATGPRPAGHAPAESHTFSLCFPFRAPRDTLVCPSVCQRSHLTRTMPVTPAHIKLSPPLPPKAPASETPSRSLLNREFTQLKISTFFSVAAVAIHNTLF